MKVKISHKGRSASVNSGNSRFSESFYIARGVHMEAPHMCFLGVTWRLPFPAFPGAVHTGLPYCFSRMTPRPGSEALGSVLSISILMSSPVKIPLSVELPGDG